MRISSLLCRLALAFALSTPLWPAETGLHGQLFGAAPAFADDDDDGGDDGDDGGGRGWGGGERTSNPRSGVGRNLFRSLQRRFQPRAPRRAQTRRAAVAVLPEQAPRQIIATGLTPEQIGRLSTEGFVVTNTAPLGTLGSDILKLDIPSGMAIEAARDRVRAEAPGAAVDFNHFFRPGEDATACDGPHCLAPSLVGWPAGFGETTGCGMRPITIGLIDTAVNPDHEVFRNGQVEIIRLSDGELPPSGRQHGTAVAALLVGSADSATPGLLPSARLISVDAFHQAPGKDDRAEAFDLVRALDLLAQRDVGVVNMSLSGPANTLVETLVARLATSNTVLVAAAGNSGPKAKPAYPAAYGTVIAVTAVDRGKRVWRRAGQGDHIDLAAPGVEVWTAASIKGARPKTGTSFAAPFVTAAAALLGSADGKLTAAEVQARLAESAEDLGDPGKDPVFGWGLLNARELCGKPAASAVP